MTERTDGAEDGFDPILTSFLARLARDISHRRESTRPLTAADVSGLDAPLEGVVVRRDEPIDDAFESP